MAAQFPLFVMRTATLALVACTLSACSAFLSAPEPVPTLVVPPTASVAEADRKLAQVATERAATEARYAGAEQVCYARFFVNYCLDAAKEERRRSLAVLRAIEIEAGHFKRKAIVEERDRALAEAEKEYAASAARQAALPPKEPRKAEEPAPAKAVKPAPAARPAQNAAESEREAARRAANVAEYEKNRLRSERRKRAVAERKAQSAAKAASKEAAKAAAAKEAAAAAKEAARSAK